MAHKNIKKNLYNLYFPSFASAVASLTNKGNEVVTCMFSYASSTDFGTVHRDIKRIEIKSTNLEFKNSNLFFYNKPVKISMLTFTIIHNNFK